MSKTKKILLSAIITGIITILALTTALAFIMPYKKQNSKQNNLEVKAYTFNEEIDPNNSDHRTKFQEMYNSTTVFEIGSPEAFKRFSHTVYYLYKWAGHGTSGRDVRFDNNYSGKTVKLTANINISGISSDSEEGHNIIKTFAGTFDGQGYTISNYSANQAFHTALIGTLNGTVKNTKFSNFDLRSGGASQGSGKDYAGVIANTNNGTIDSCIVNNPTFKSGRSRGDFYCGAISGKNNGTIKNCIVSGTYKLCADDGVLGVSACGIDAYPFIASGNNASYSIFTASYNALDSDGYDNEETAYSTSLGTNNYSSFKSAHDAWKNGVYTQCSNIPGTIEDYPNYPWFQYGNGSGVASGSSTLYLQLRAFMSFTTYTIQAGEGGNVKNTLTGSVGKSAILCVPTQFEGISYTSSDGVGYASPTNYKATSDGDAIFTVETVADQYYIFDGWNDTTATFKRNKTIIQFASVTVGGTTIYDSEEIVVDYLDGEPLGDPNYDKTNHTLTYTYSVDGTPTTFVYNFADENAWTVDVTNGSAYSWDATGSAKLTITPTFKLKEYGSVWQ